MLHLLGFKHILIALDFKYTLCLFLYIYIYLTYLHVNNYVDYKHHFQLLMPIIQAPLTSEESGVVTDVVGID